MRNIIFYIIFIIIFLTKYKTNLKRIFLCFFINKCSKEVYNYGTTTSGILIQNPSKINIEFILKRVLNYNIFLFFLKC